MAAKFPNQVGLRYGRLVVTGHGVAMKYMSFFCVQCDCGSLQVMRGSDLRTGKRQSCGCLTRERVIKSATVHGMLKVPEYCVWQTMRARCKNPKSLVYRRYGGRGIIVCERWDSFANFYADMGPRPARGYQLDRIDNDGNYEPGNCRWATNVENASNTSANRRIAWRGENHTVSAWSRITGIRPGTIRHRLNSGWTAERALTGRIQRYGYS